MNNYNNSGLCTLLERSVSQCQFRNVLKCHGISATEPVRIDIESSNEVIASYSLPLNDNSESLVQDKIAPLTELRTQIVELLNQGQDSHKLVEEIQSSDPKSSFFKVSINVGKENFDTFEFFNSTITFTMGYLRPCPPDRPICAI